MLTLIYYLLIIPLYLPIIFLKIVFYPLTLLRDVFKELEKGDKYFYNDHFI